MRRTVVAVAKCRLHQCLLPFQNCIFESTCPGAPACAHRTISERPLVSEAGAKMHFIDDRSLASLLVVRHVPCWQSPELQSTLTVHDVRPFPLTP